MSDRYEKQQRFEPIGEAGQQRLAESKVVVIGCGALGALAAEQLVRSGAGHVRLVDRDFVEWSNLQRQVLYTESDARDRTPKAVAAAEHLGAINSEVVAEPVVADLTRRNCDEIIDSSVSLVIDGTDNLETRYLVNEVCLDQATPWIYGGCVGSQGQAALFYPPSTPCLRCLFPELPAPGQTDTCDTVGVLAPAAHVVSCLQVGMALRALTDSPEAAGGRLQIVDVWDGTMRSVKLTSSDGCETCRDGERPFRDGESGGEVAVLCGRNAVQITPDGRHELDLSQLEKKLAPFGSVTTNRFLLRAEPRESSGLSLTVFRDGRVIVQGTDNPATARSAVARYIGV